MRSSPLPLAIVLVLVVSSFAMTIPHALAASPTPRYLVSGAVVDDHGAPLAGIQVNGYVYDNEKQTNGNDQTTTDEKGEFALSLPAGTGAVNAFAQRYGGSNVPVDVQGDIAGLKVVMPSPPTRDALVQGIVRGPDGAPIAGATVRIQQGCCYGGVMTPMPAPASQPESVNATEGSTGSGSTTSADAAPPSDGKMIAPYYCCDAQDPIVTKDDGSYAFKTTPGPHDVIVEAKGYGQSSVHVDAVSNETVTKDVTLEKVPAADAKVQGRVLDASTGLPIANAQVSLYNAEWSRNNWTQTAADGTYSFQTLPGWSQLTVSADGYGMPIPVDTAGEGLAIRAPDSNGHGYYQYAHTLTLQSGANTQDVKLQPKPLPTVTLLGYVLDPTTKTGVPGANVNVWNQDAGEWGNAQTDKTGSYKMLVRPGHYTINAYAQDHLPGVESFAIAPGETKHRADVEVFPGNAKYAPCDGSCYPGPYYMKDSGAPMRESIGTTAPASANPPAGGATPGNLAAAAPQSPTPNAIQAYDGQGGGLPPYGTEGSDATTTSGPTDAPTKSVPGAGLAILLGAAAVALMVRRAQR